LAEGKITPEQHAAIVAQLTASAGGSDAANPKAVPSPEFDITKLKRHFELYWWIYAVFVAFLWTNITIRNNMVEEFRQVCTAGRLRNIDCSCAAKNYAQARGPIYVQYAIFKPSRSTIRAQSIEASRTCVIPY
jgi:hypothetical protein